MVSWHIDNPRDRLIVLLGLAVVEQLLRSRDFEGYPSEVKYEILAAIVELQEKFTKPTPPPTRYDQYGNPY